MPFVNQSVKDATQVLLDEGLPDDVIVDTRTVIANAPEVVTTLANPIYHQKDKDAVIAKVFPEAIVPYLTVLCRHDGFGMLPDILRNYVVAQETARGKGIGTLWYAGDEPDKDALAKLVADKFGIVDIQWVIHKDPSLLGGFKIRIKDYVYDHSVAGAFAQLQHKLTEVRV